MNAIDGEQRPPTPTRGHLWAAEHGHGIRIAGVLLVFAVVIDQVVNVVGGDAKPSSWVRTINIVAMMALCLGVLLPRVEKDVARWRAGHEKNVNGEASAPGSPRP